VPAISGTGVGARRVDLRIDLADDRQQESVGGRPLISTDPDLHVSCSASSRVGLVAIVAGSEVGVVVQEHSDEDARRRRRGMAGARRGAGAAASAVRRPAARRHALRTQKEAVLKGLGVSLRQRAATVVTPVGEAGRIGEWEVRSVPVQPGYVASVVVRTPMDEVELVVRDMPLRETR
jgi:hypothetical protein